MVNIVKITPQLHYCGKILKQGHKYYTGTFFKKLNSGKSICLDYKNGLLRKSVLSNGEMITKSYDYDKNKRLINVNKNGENVFVKTIKNKLGIDFYRTEIINDSIYKAYNNDNQLIYNRILPKSLSSCFTHFYSAQLKTDVVREDRFYISNLIKCSDGNYYIKAENKRITEPKYELFKIIYRFPKMNNNIVLNKNGNKITGNIKDKNGNIISQLKTLLDKNSKPMWEKIINDGSLLVDFKSFFSKEGLKEKEISILNFQYFKSAFDKTFDSNGNIVKERIIERSKNDDIKGINIFKRKFDENNLMIKENKFKETGSGKKLIYTIKKEYNFCKLPVKEDFYNAKGELENSEYNVYDKRGRLRVSGYHEYGKYPESSYVVFDKNGIIRKKAILDEIEGSITEEYYDKNSLYIKKIIKNEKGLIFHKYDFIYDTDKKNRIRTIKRDGNNNIELTIDYLKGKDNKTIKVYKGPDGKLIGKEFIKQDEKGYKHYFTNSEGKRCDFVELLIAVHGDMGI